MMKPEDVYRALHLCSVKLPPDPDPSTSRSPTPRNGMPAVPVEYPNVELRHFRMFGSEADYLMLNTYTGVVAEYEIKVAKSDLIRECKIARAAANNEPSLLGPRDNFKHEKHRSFCKGRSLPPNYYSFVVPVDLLDACVSEAPQYAGVYKAERAATGWISITVVRPPTLVSSVKADGIFFARCAEHLFGQLSDLHVAATQIKITRAESHRKYLMDIARAVREAEILIAQSGRCDEGTKRFLIERAVSGLSQRDKDHVARYYWSGDFLRADADLDGRNAQT
jgi:hypothetical protein